MDVRHLYRPDVRALRLRLAYDVYTSVNQNLEALFQVDVGDRGYNFVDIVRQISEECLRKLVIGPEKSPSFYNKQIQNGFQGIRDRLEVDPVHTQFVPIIDEIAQSFRPQSPEDCYGGLAKMMMDGWEFFKAMIHECGGPLSQERLDFMLARGPASLDLRLGDREFTYCHYLRAEHEIRLLAGEHTDLFAIFDLSFYFLHEYTSHSYAVWDDSRWRFSESYLLRAAERYLDAYRRDHDRARRPFLAVNFDALRARCDPTSASDLSRVDDCFAELYELVGDRLITYLLEWATVPANGGELSDRGRVLSGFHALVKDADSAYETFIKTDSARPFDTVYSRLISIAKARLNH